jgi:hypothetical protein
LSDSLLAAGCASTILILKMNLISDDSKKD